MSTERERLDEIGKKIKRETDATGNPAPRRLLGLSGALNTVNPCAACKLLRRRCAQECPFAPYLSPHEPHKFAAVHKVFGASNVSNMLLEVPEAKRADAANSPVYEANLRLRDPVYGCMVAISVLEQQVNALESELDVVRAEIIKHRYRQAGAGSGLTDDAAQATAGFVSPAPPVHAGDVVSVANPAGAPGMSASSAVYVAEAAVEHSSSTTDHYAPLDTSDHGAYFG